MQNLKKLARALRSDKSGVAMVEFALSVPFLMIIGLASGEVATLAVASMRVNQVALQVSDHAARIRASIDESDIEQILAGARLAGESIDLGTKGRVILSSLEHNGQTDTNAGQTIRWQRCFGLKSYTSSYGVEGDGATTNAMATGMGDTGNKITSPASTAVMFVEVRYEYVPQIAPWFMGTREIKTTAAFNVRDRLDHVMKNTTSITTANKRLCSRFSAT